MGAAQKKAYQSESANPCGRRQTSTTYRSVNPRFENRGFFMPCERKLFQGIKIPPYVVVRCGGIFTTYGGRESGFSFAAVFSVTNEVGIDKDISVGYKGKCIT